MGWQLQFKFYLSSGKEFEENFLDSKHVLKIYFKPRRKNPDFGFLPDHILPVWLKIGHLSKYFSVVFSLILQALQDVTDKDDPELVKKYKKELERAIEIHDLTLDRKGPYSPTYRTFPLPFNAKLRKKKKYKKAKKEKNVLVKQHKTVPFYEFPENHKQSLKYFRGNFHSMCEGNSINSTNIDHKLKCRLQHHNVPYLKLGPFKIEELNQDPFIISFKDFLYHEEIETLKSLAADNLKLSQVGMRDSAKKDTDLR